jgi:hypothetical protein
LNGTDFISGNSGYAFGIECLLRVHSQRELDAPARQDEKLQQESAAFHGFRLVIVWRKIPDDMLWQGHDERPGLLPQRFLDEGSRVCERSGTTHSSIILRIVPIFGSGALAKFEELMSEITKMDLKLTT